MKRLKKLIQKILSNLSGEESPKLAITQPIEKPEPKHLHVWTMVARTYAPPTTFNISGGTVDIKDTKSLEKMSFGVTSLLWECEKCGETRKEEMLGSDDDTLEELIQKVNRTGPQYLERGETTYIFNKWQPASAIPGNLPIR